MLLCFTATNKEKECIPYTFFYFAFIVFSVVTDLDFIYKKNFPLFMSPSLVIAKSTLADENNEEKDFPYPLTLCVYCLLCFSY